jgi:hypothetical protein
MRVKPVKDCPDPKSIRDQRKDFIGMAHHTTGWRDFQKEKWHDLRIVC